ncbi:hypothetical protein GCM10023310_27590 [Paenibacillus vulneris]|nr:putative amidophosphoribosyltransferase [Paenibacillus sp. OAS669]
MTPCPNCKRNTELQKQKCPHCGKTFQYTVAQKFDLMAESVEAALRLELERRKKAQNHNPVM